MAGYDAQPHRKRRFSDTPQDTYESPNHKNYRIQDDNNFQDHDSNGRDYGNANAVTRIPCPGEGIKWTVAIAVPGSLLNNATTPGLRTYIAGQVARAAAIFCVDEIVIYNDNCSESQIEKPLIEKDQDPMKNVRLLARILQYLECPNYLRRYFFPQHDDLKFVGLLNFLEAPHHLRAEEICLYREGIVTDPQPESTTKSETTSVNVGLWSDAQIYGKLQPGLRVTVKFRDLDSQDDVVYGDPVAPHTPRTADGFYWGYQVRIADSLNGVLLHSKHDDGYDLTIGVGSDGEPASSAELPNFQHAIIILGGVRSVEDVLKDDTKLKVKDPRDLFDAYLSPLPTLSCIHVRTEEALLSSLSVLRPKMIAAAALSTP